MPFKVVKIRIAEPNNNSNKKCNLPGEDSRWHWDIKDGLTRDIYGDYNNETTPWLSLV